MQLADFGKHCAGRCNDVYQWHFYSHSDGGRRTVVYFNGAEKMEIYNSCSSVHDTWVSYGRNPYTAVREEKDARGMV